MRMANVAIGPALAVLAAAVTGCGGGPVGIWQSREAVTEDGSKRTELEVVDEGGELELYVQITPAEGLVRIDYDVDTWFEEQGGDYEFQLTCNKNCQSLSSANLPTDFEMDCTYDSSNEWLDCSAKRPWTDYGFFEFEQKPE